MNNGLPSVSIIIPTYNEAENITMCLDAIIRQDYQSELIEIIIVDNVSVDETIEIVKRYMTKHSNIMLAFNEVAKDAEVSKMIGLQQAKGELFLYLDADIQVVGRDWLTRLINPLIERYSLVGSFPRFVPNPMDTAIGRYLRYHPLELDPVFQFFCTEIKETIVEHRVDYEICEFHPPQIPPIGICIYRREVLIEAIGNMRKFMDVDVPVILSKKGSNRFAHVSSCGIYHTNVKNIREIVRRRCRNVKQIYLPNLEMREFVYFNREDRKDLMRIAWWAIYANLFVPSLAKGIWKTLWNKDLACMYEPVVAMVLTDAIALEFLKSEKGRNMFRRWIKR